jgi:hypothetical protein
MEGHKRFIEVVDYRHSNDKNRHPSGILDIETFEFIDCDPEKVEVGMSLSYSDVCGFSPVERLPQDGEMVVIVSTQYEGDPSLVCEAKYDAFNQHFDADQGWFGIEDVIYWRSK